MVKTNDAFRLASDLGKDPGLLQQFLNAGAPGFADLAKREGYACTALDFYSAMSGELSDDDIKNVSGGSDVPNNLLALLAALRP